MRRLHKTIVYITVGMLPGLALAALALILLWPRTVPPDTTSAPNALKTLCKVDTWRPWREIVIHHTAGARGNLALIDRYHRTEPKRMYESAGYHFIIGNGTLSGDGEIEIGPRWQKQETGAHCKGHNRTAIGIALIGNFELPGQKPSEEQMAALAELTAYLMLRYNIPGAAVQLHREVPGARTLCPGKSFPTVEFQQRVAAAYRKFQTR
jgi:hypothetical protein